MSNLSDVDVTFLSSIVLLAPNGQFVGCATVTLSERIGTDGRAILGYMERNRM
jgi:hypothetical protein